jgi:outer membrane protein OmpA-like peptidoglycan-associated protein
MLFRARSYIIAISGPNGAANFRVRAKPAGALPPASSVPISALHDSFRLSEVGADKPIAIPWQFSPGAAGQRWTISLQTPPGTPIPFHLRDRTGKELAFSTGGNAQGIQRIADLGLQPGNYTILIDPAADMPFILGATADGPRQADFAEEPDDDRNRPKHEITPGAQMRGRLVARDREDTDEYTLDIPASLSGHAFDLSLIAAGTRALNMAIFSAQHAMISRGGTGSVRLNSMALDPGRYVVEVRGALRPEQEYRLDVSDAGPRPPGVALDPNDTFETASRIIAGQGITGTLARDDPSHYLRFDVEKPSDQWNIQVTGDGVGAVTLFDQSRNQVARADRTQGSSIVQLARLVLPAGPHFLKVEGDQGTYLAQAQDLGPPQPGEQAAADGTPPKAPRNEDRRVNAKGENSGASLTVTRYTLTHNLGNRLPRVGQVYLVLHAEWRNKITPQPHQETISISVPSERLFLLLNGDRRAPLEENGRQLLLDSGDQSRNPLQGDIAIPVATGVVAGDYVFQIPERDAASPELIYAGDDGVIRIPLGQERPPGPAPVAIAGPIAGPANLSELKISLIGSQQVETVGSQQVDLPREYLLVDLWLDNRGTRPVALWDGQVTLRDPEGNEYRGTYLRDLEYRFNPGVLVPPGVPLRATCAFDVPSAHYALALTIRGGNNSIVQLPIPASGPAPPSADKPLLMFKTNSGTTIDLLDLERIPTLGHLRPESPNRFEILELLATSESDKEDRIKPEQFSLLNGDTPIPPDGRATSGLASPLSGGTPLPPRQKLNFGMAFQVPPDARNLALQYKSDDGTLIKQTLPVVEAQAPSSGASAAIPSGTDLASADMGGEIESMTGTVGPGFTGRNLLVADAGGWMPENGVTYPYDIVLSFYKRSPALVSAVIATLSDDAPIAPREMEVWVSNTSPSDAFTKVGGATVDPKVRDQVIAFAPVMARYVRFRILSGNSPFALGLSKLKVIEGNQPGYTPLLKQYPQIADWKYTPRHSAQLGIEFLEPFTARWQAEHQCYGCHIHAQTLMGLAIGSRNDYVVSRDLMDRIVQFLDDKQDPAGSITDSDKVIGTQFAAMALAYAVGDDGRMPDPHLIRAADWLITQQVKSGEIPIERNTPPIVQGTIMSTANAVTAFLRAYNETGDKKYKDAADRGLVFIAGRTPANTQDEIFTVIALSRYGTPEQKRLVDKVVARLKSEELDDGGWRETPQMAGSNAFATGQVLYAFKVAGVAMDSPEFKRGVAYLVTTQNSDGSWPAVNTQSGAKTVDAPTMWAVIGLAGSFDARVAEPKVTRDENEIVCEKVRKLAALLDEEGKVILHINFDFDQATLRPDALPTIEQITKLLRDYPSLRLEVDGHTDNIGTPKRNLILSRQRADTVVQALVAHGIDRSRLKSAGFGMSRPVAANATPDGRFKNRRVELIRESPTGLHAGTSSRGTCGNGVAAGALPSPAVAR